MGERATGVGRAKRTALSFVAVCVATSFFLATGCGTLFTSMEQTIELRPPAGRTIQGVVLEAGPVPVQNNRITLERDNTPTLAWVVYTDETREPIILVPGESIPWYFWLDLLFWPIAIVDGFMMGARAMAFPESTTLTGTAVTYEQ
jgi:hypothetical protein